MLHDKTFSKYIYWSTDSKSVIIPNETLFAKKVLPKFGKTNNFQSFIRQLNLYNFRKIIRIEKQNRGEISEVKYMYEHKEFNRFMTEEEIKLIKKK